MDKIWYRNPSKSEVIGRCSGDEKKRMTTQNRQKSNAKKLLKKISMNIPQFVMLMLYISTRRQPMKSSHLFYFCFQLRRTAKGLEYKAIDLALAGHPQFDLINVFTIDS